MINKGKFYQKINETEVMDHDWCHDHWRSISLNYCKAPFFKEYEDRIRSIYEACEKETHLSQINYRFLTELCDILGIHTKITWSSDYTLSEGKTERLVNLCLSAGGDAYLSGPAAKDYIVDQCFTDAQRETGLYGLQRLSGISQSFGAFEHGVSVLDLIFHTGPNAHRYMKSFPDSIHPGGDLFQ